MHLMPFRLLFLLLLPGLQASAQYSTDIKINQEGFYTTAKKEAILTGNSAAGVFYIVRLNSKDTVFKGKPGSPLHSKNSSLTGSRLDFSAVSLQGRFQVYVPGTGISYPFSISDHPLHATAVSSLKGFYYQRVSMPLEPAYAGKWARPAGHADQAVLVHPSAATAKRPAGTVIASPGGWYDAGDYNKYIVNSGITMGTLFGCI